MSGSLARRSEIKSLQQHFAHELNMIEARQAIAERKTTAQRQVAQWGVAQTVRLRNTLRAIEEYCPDAAPTAAVFVRIAEGAMIAAALEFEAGM